ncbi:hypothetical protein FRX31_033847, partial [Thalictrum thalictroides]
MKRATQKNPGNRWERIFRGSLAADSSDGGGISKSRWEEGGGKTTMGGESERDEDSV